MNKVSPELLIQTRKSKGKTQEVLGKALNIDQSAYSRKEKAGEFTDKELEVICKTLGIKKEQILLQGNELVIQELTLITNKILKNESALDVILSTQAEILANLTNGSATKIRKDLESVVNSLTRQALEQLGHRV